MNNTPKRDIIMDSLSKKLVELFTSELTEERILTHLFIRKLTKAGIEINDIQQSHIEQQIKKQIDIQAKANNPTLSLTIEWEDLELEQQLVADNRVLNIGIELTDDDVAEYDEITRQAMHETVVQLVAEAGPGLLEEWKQEAPAVLGDHEVADSQFREELKLTWANALTKLDMLLNVTLELGSSFNDTNRPAAATSNDLVFEALVRLHARGCQVARESLLLLQHGFADGAQARWRTLHEIAITACFIDSHGQDVANRYLSHSIVDTYKTMRQFQNHSSLFGWKPISKRETSNIEKQYKAILAKFGSKFKSDYGWAANALGITNGDIYFADIEKNAGYEHFRPLFKDANSNIHAGARGVSFRLGAPPRNPSLMVAGSSVFGLTDPGRNTAYSITLLTLILLFSKTSLENVISMKAVVELSIEVQQAFEKASRRGNIKSIRPLESQI